MQRWDLVGRFVTATEWSTAKKTAVVALAFGAPLQVLQFATTRPLALSGTIDASLLDLFLLAILHTLVTGLISAWVASRGHEGTWTYYLMFLPYLAIAGYGLYAVGFASALLLVLFLPPLAVLPLYKLRETIVSLLMAGLVVVGPAGATAAGLVEYAPAFRSRSLDVFGEASFIVGGFGLLLPALVVFPAMMLILTAAYRRDRMHLAETRDQLQSAVGLISKYVPAEVASGILAGTEIPQDGYKRQKVTAFFSDIVGFTNLSEEMEPEDLAVVLNEYFTEMAEIAQKHRGTVDELQGDGLVLVFGAPNHVSDRQHALDAVRAAAEMQEAIGQLNERWRDEGIDVRISVRIGINTGVVTVGHFGTKTRLKYTVIGKHVNLASRIQAMCEPGKVLISNATWLLVNEEVSATSLGEHSFKGITRPVEVFQVD